MNSLKFTLQWKWLDDGFVLKKEQGPLSSLRIIGPLIRGPKITLEMAKEMKCVEG